MEAIVVIAILSVLSVLLLIAIIIIVVIVPAWFSMRRFPSKTSAVRICSPAPDLSTGEILSNYPGRLTLLAMVIFPYLRT